MKTAKKSKALIVLIIGLVVLILGSVLAQTFNTSMYSVKVDRIYFDTESGTLSGLLYMPKDASASNPKPTLVTTHGYLNSAEMQDAPAIEMSRRGYVVLALDMYDHGHSKGNAEHTGSFLSFWPTSILDAVTYMYQQPYVLKDEAGNGIIAVSGHSMGGFSTTMALYYDELSAMATGVRMIYTGLTAGSDYSYTAWLGLDAATGASMFGGRTVGKIAAEYDEFFFNAAGTSGTVNQKNYVATPEGQTFLGLISYDADGKAVLDPNAAPNTWYTAADGGQRIIYQPSEIHPWNHFSTTTTGHMIDFYKTAFADYQGLLKDIGSGNQIWWLKEACELVAMVGFFMVIFALAALLLKVPFLSKAVTGTPALTAPAATTRGRAGYVTVFIASMLIPAVIYSAMNGSVTAEARRWLSWVGIIAVVAAVIALIISLASKEENKKSWISGSILTILAGCGLWYLTGKQGIPNNQTFQGPTVSTIATWAVVCAAIGIIIMVSGHLLGAKKEKGATLANYGLPINVMGIISSLIIAIVVSVVAYALVFAVDGIFKVDFRIWTFAFKSFEWSAIPAALAYMPFFLIYYLEMGAAAVSNTSSEKLQGFWGYVLAALTNMGGIALWLVLQYGKLFITGSAFYPGEALSGILLQALVPTLAIASCLTKYLYKKTGNIYAGAFLNTILMTIMTVANTAVYFQ